MDISYYQKQRIINDTNITPLYNKNNYTISDKTITQYQNIINRVHLKFIKKPFNKDLKNIFDKKDTEEIDDILNDMKYLNLKFPDKMKNIYINPTTLKTYIMPYVRLLSISNDLKYIKLYKYFTSYIISLNKDYEKTRDDNFINENDKKKMITDFNNDTLLNNTEKLSNINDKVIYGVYSFVPPRRLEYANMYISNKSNKRSNQNNYIVIYRGNPEKFIFNDYKTKKTFGQQEYIIPSDLAKIIKKYIYGNKLKNGDKFLPFNEKALSNIIIKVFFKVYNEKINLNFIRKSYATYINDMNISNNEKEKLAEAMGHSLSQSMKYKKIIT